MLEQGELHVGDVDGQRESIGLEGTLDIAAVVPDSEALVQGESDALCHPPLDLPADSRRVDRTANLLNDDVADDPDAAGHRIDLNDGHVHVVRRGGHGGEHDAAAACRVVGDWRSGVRARRRDLPGGPQGRRGGLGNRDRTCGGSNDRDRPLDDLEIADACLEHVGSRTQQLRSGLRGCVASSAPDDMGGSAALRACVIALHVGIGHRDRD